MKKMRTTVSVLLLLAMVFALAACGGQAPAQEPTQGTAREPAQGTTQTEPAPAAEPAAEPAPEEKDVEELRIGTTKTCDHFGNFCETGAYAYMDIYSTTQQAFWQVDEHHEIVGDFFYDWEISDDNMTMVCKFDPRATWSDGTPVTAEDVKFTFDYHMSVIKNDYTSQLESAEILAEDTIQLNFKEPAAFAFLYKCRTFVYPVPKSVWENVEEPKTYEGEGATIGCGPYVLGEVDLDAQSFTLIARDNYYLGTPTVKKITVKCYGTQEALALALKSKEVDCMADYSAGLPATLSSQFVGQAHLDPGETDNPGNVQLGFGNNAAPSNEVNFRNAVSYALDHELIAAAVGGDYGVIPGRGVIAPCNTGFDPSVPTLTRDIDKAKGVLDEAGYQDVDGDGIREGLDGQPMEVVITTQWGAAKKELYLRLAEIVIANLKDVGIKAVVDQESLENQDHYRQVTFTDRSYQLLIHNNTSGIAFFKTAFFYAQNKYGTWGTHGDAELIEIYDKMLQAQNFEDYCKYAAALQQYNDANTILVALGWNKIFYPYRTDIFTGWKYVPGDGPVYYRTWFELHAV